MKDFSPIFRAKIENGKLELENKQAFVKYASTLGKGEYEILIRRKMKRRSIPQNNLYWGVYIPILSEHFGYEAEEMHEALKLKFLIKQGKLPTLESTAKLSTLRFGDYLDKIQRWAMQEYQINIPNPEELWLNSLGSQETNFLE